MAKEPGGIDRSSPVPIYHQLKVLLLAEIAAGRYPEGRRLPTEHELCDRYGISRSPVTRALTELADEGVVVRRRRLGTIVDPGWAPPGPGPAKPVALVPDAPWVGAAGIGTGGAGVMDVRTCPPDEVQTRLAAAVGEGSAPDIALVDSSEVAALVAAGFVHHLGELDEPWANDLALDVPATAATGGYGAPAAARLTGLWLHRGAAGEAAASWEGLRELARAARDGDPGVVSPLVMAAGGRPRAVAEAVVALVASHGGAVIDDAGIAVASPESVAALEALRSMVAESLMSADVASYREADVAVRLATGAAIAAIGRSDLAPEVASAAGVAPAAVWDHFAFAPLPGSGIGAPSACVGSWSFVVLRQSQQARAAAAAVRGVIEAAPPVPSAASGLVPVRSSIAEISMLQDPGYPLADALRAAVVPRSTGAAAVVAAELRRLVQTAITGGIRVPEAAAMCGRVLAAVTGA